MKPLPESESATSVKALAPVSRQRARYLALVGLSSALLVARVALTSPSFDAVAVARAAVSGLALVVVGILTVDASLNKKRPLVARLSSKSRRLAAAAYLTTYAVCVLDVAAGVDPYLFIPGMVVYCFFVWDRPGFLAVSAGLCAYAVTRAMAAFGRGVGADDFMMLAFGVIVALYAADTVKKSVLPSEERLRALSLENEELWNLSFRDTLTGLYNRRYIQQIAIHLFSRAVRYKEQLHVLMIDIDHFKRVNDKLGHAVGDEVLKGVAQTIQATIRTSDTVARFGGEEFIVYMVRSDPETTQFIANRIRDGVAAVQFPGVPWQITISVGVAGLQENDTIDSLVERSDQFLYVSKHRGRNRVSGF
ncbi:MAG TPA: GGDEF domain-containing protein [Spirochaetales bacterium]|nr:GGDEF domain-containing protein [Spirochaetales bacterium]HPM73010.1 GGDEF domain-containing protein [Spirochaetales bacterium]